MTVAEIVPLGGPIPVAAGTFETRGKHEEPKVKLHGSFEASKTTTVTRIATSRSPIPVTVGTFERFGLGRGGPYHGGG